MGDKIKEINGRLDESDKAEFLPTGVYADRFKVVKSGKVECKCDNCTKCGGENHERN